MKVVLLLLFSSLNSVCGYRVTINDARLTGGNQGTVEVLTQRGWLPVCSSYWSRYQESRVLCRQLGYDNPYYTPGTSTSSSSNTSLWFYFYCSGVESEISMCSYSFSSERTSCSYIVSVTCSPCTQGRVQLRGGIVPEAGSVEYCDRGIWRAICEHAIDYKDAFVLCRQLEFPATGATVYTNSYFGNNQITSGVYFNCFGNESSLSNCQTSTASCNFVNTAGVYCTGEVIENLCINGHLRLAGGNDMNEGRVEICSNGVWGTIYNGGYWDSRDAKVVCRQLGLYLPYSRVEVFRGTYFGRGTGPILYAYLNCDGTETALADCSYISFPFSVSHSNDAGVRCTRNTVNTRSDCNNGDVRLVNGTTSSEGRVEICYDGVWGSVCDNSYSWNDQDAAIVCLQLGFQGANATALRYSYFGDGTGPYHLNGVDCSGEERTLLECSHSAIGYHTCPSGRDVGVRCDASPCTHGEVRLFGGYTDHDGVAEVCINGFWADICDDVSDQATLSRTFCRQFMGEGSLYSYSSYSCCGRRRNTGNITLYSVSCGGSSGQFIQDCSYQVVSGYSTSGCSLREELLIGCYEPSSCTAGDVRLRGGNSTQEGRVEFCSQGLWGSIATPSWSSSDAVVVCRQLGYPWEWSLAETNGIFSRSSTRNVAWYFSCSGREQHLADCSYSSITSSSGFSYESYYSSGVICQGNTSAPTECKHGDVRLTDGKRPTEGRVEICARGYWATTCNRNWNEIATEIVCRQLGLPTNGLEYVSGDRFGLNYQIPIVDVYCSSVRSTNISECSIYTQQSYCNRKNTIGIYCQDYTEEGYFHVTIDVIPVQQSYDIGSQVKLNCTVDPVAIHNGDVVSYQWTSSQRSGTVSYSKTPTVSIQTYYLDSVEYHCKVFRNQRPFGTRTTTLNIRGLLLRNNDKNIQVREHGTVQIQTMPLKIAVLNSLLSLTWYHNGSVIAPNYSPRHTFSNRNKTMTITNFSSADAGIYQAQFNELFVYPFDENCRDNVLSLLRNHPILKPAVFCINMLGSCSDTVLKAQEREISVQYTYSSLERSLNNFTLMASGTVLSSKELQHATIWWYRNGQRVTADLSAVQRNYNSLTIRQKLQVVNGHYEHSGRYEALLKIDMFAYLQHSSCQPYYNRFVRQLTRYMTLAQGYVDVYYYRDLTFSLVVGKDATSGDGGTNLTCRASIQFPPFSMLSLIKNGQTVATSTSGSLQIDTRSVNANPFGLYTCQLNASGATFQRSNTLKERANLRMTVDMGDSTICSGTNKLALDVALTLKISSDCGCNFNRADLRDSAIDCKDNGELDYSTNLEYSNDEGSETASVIANRLVDQAPFSMTVQGIPATVTSACTDCTTTGTTLSQAAGGGLFVGGFVVAALLIGVIALVIIVLLIKRRGTKSADGGTVVKADPVRYATGAQKNAPAKVRSKKVELFEQQDYEVMDPVDQAIYEETF